MGFIMATCVTCNGKKKVPGLGFMQRDCYSCSGTGIKPVDIIDKDSKIDDKIKELQAKIDDLAAVEKRLKAKGATEISADAEPTVQPVKRAGRPKKAE